jgi:hypothetical protein
MNDADQKRSVLPTLDYPPARPPMPLPKFGVIALAAAIIAPLMALLLARPHVSMLEDKGRAGVAAAFGVIGLAFGVIAIINKGKDRVLGFLAIVLIAIVFVLAVIPEL